MDSGLSMKDNGDVTMATRDSVSFCAEDNSHNSISDSEGSIRDTLLSTPDSSTDAASPPEIKNNNTIMRLKNRTHFLLFCGFVAALSLVAVVCLSVGVYRYHKAKLQVCGRKVAGVNALNKDQVQLENILNRIKSDYFKLYPNEVYANPEVGIDEIVDNFVPYDPSWQALKTRTDHARKLRQELSEMNIQASNLRPREKKALAQAEHYLESNFGNPYDENYYAGDWMLGPNYFCWQHICAVARTLGYHYNPLNGYIPDSVEGVEKIIETIKQMKVTYGTYRNNMVLGVKTGMVRSVKDCEAGYNAFIANFPNTQDGADGKFDILSIEYTFYSFLFSYLKNTNQNVDV